MRFSSPPRFLPSRSWAAIESPYFAIFFGTQSFRLDNLFVLELVITWPSAVTHFNWTLGVGLRHSCLQGRDL